MAELTALAKLIADELRRRQRKPADLARGIKTSRQRVSKWLTGDSKRIPDADVRRIAEYLGMDAAGLLALQAGYKPPESPRSDFLTPDAQSLARRWQALPEPDKRHIVWLVETLGAMRSESYVAWETQMASKAKVRSKT